LYNYNAHTKKQTYKQTKKQTPNKQLKYINNNNESIMRNK